MPHKSKNLIFAKLGALDTYDICPSLPSIIAIVIGIAIAII
jgi:hypothetical protein